MTAHGNLLPTSGGFFCDANHSAPVKISPVRPRGRATCACRAAPPPAARCALPPRAASRAPAGEQCPWEATLFGLAYHRLRHDGASIERHTNDRHQIKRTPAHTVARVARSHRRTSSQARRLGTRTGTVFTLTDVGAWSGHQRALKLRASKGMMWTPSLTTAGAGARRECKNRQRQRREGKGHTHAGPHMTRADRGGKDLAFAKPIGFCQCCPTFMDWDGTAPTLAALDICPLCARLLHQQLTATPHFLDLQKIFHTERSAREAEVAPKTSGNHTRNRVLNNRQGRPDSVAPFSPVSLYRSRREAVMAHPTGESKRGAISTAA